MRVLVICLCFIVAASAASIIDIGKEEWETFKVTYSKNYKSDAEEKARMKIFMDNKHDIAKHNQKYEQGLVSYELGINQFADLSLHEFNNLMNGGFNRSYSQVFEGFNGIRETFVSSPNVSLPASFDWRTKGAVTPVKNQGVCGSCWAFSATGTLEGQHFVKTKKLISLSEQNLMDCSKRYGTHGCKSGWPYLAFWYIKENGGIDTEESYPYKESDNTDGKCHFDKTKIGATDNGFVDIFPPGDEAKLMEAVATIGPVSVTFDGMHSEFVKYKKGIYNQPACVTNRFSHAALVVGYGTENGKDYWLVKNSFGTSWGEKGYIRMSRNKNNQCGIASIAVYPKV